MTKFIIRVAGGAHPGGFHLSRATTPEGVIIYAGYIGSPARMEKDEVDYALHEAPCNWGKGWAAHAEACGLVLTVEEVEG